MELRPVSTLRGAINQQLWFNQPQKALGHVDVFVFEGKNKPTRNHHGFGLFPPTAGVSAQIGAGVVWGGPEVRFHEGSTRVLRGLRGSASTQTTTARCWGYHLRGSQLESSCGVLPQATTMARAMNQSHKADVQTRWGCKKTP